MADQQHSKAVFVNSCVTRARPPRRGAKVQLAATMSGRQPLEPLEVLGKSVDVVMESKHGAGVDSENVTTTGLYSSTIEDDGGVNVDGDWGIEGEQLNGDAGPNVESLKLDMETISSESFYRKLQELKEENYKTLRMMDALYRDRVRDDGPPPDVEGAADTQPDQHIDGRRPDLDTSSSSLSKISKMWDEFSVDEYAPREKRPPSNKRTGSRSFNTKPRDVKRAEAWEPQITVPQPFRMTVRDALKPQKLSRSQIDMFKDMIEKEKAEEKECEQQFRANPAPGHIYLPLYDEITRRNEQRRREVKEHSEELLKGMEKPFSFVKREEEKRKMRSKSASRVPTTPDFRARSVPKHIYDDSASDRLKEEELFRDIRIKMRSEELLKKSQLPKNMQLRGREYTLGELRRKLQAERESLAFLTDDHNFNPSINHDVPDYTEIYRRFQQKVRNSKQEKEPTIVQPFNLHTGRIPSTKEKILEDIENDERMLTENRWPYQAPRRAPTPGDLNRALAPDSIPAKMTHSAELRQSKTLNNLNSQANTITERQQQDQDRKFREMKLRKFISTRSSSNDNSRTLEEVRADKVRKHKESDRSREAAYKNELEEMMGRVSSRPLLFEREEQINARRAAEKRYEDALRGAGLCDEFVRSRGGGEGGYVSVSESEDDSSQYQSLIAE